MEIVFLLFFIMMGWGCAQLCGISIEQGIFSMMTVSFITLFISGLLGILAVGFILLLFVAVAALVYILIQAFKQNIQWRQVVTPGLVVLVLAYMSYYFVTRQAMLHMWDEASHWGTTVKHIYGTHQLWTSGLQTIASALIHYIMCQFAGYHEASLYLSQWFIQWTCLILILSNVQWKDWKRVLLFALGGYGALATFMVNGQLTLYSDLVLGIFAGSMVCGWLLDKESGNKRYIWLGPGIFMLTQIKSGTGMMLSIFLILTVVAVEFTRQTRLRDKLLPFALFVPMIFSQVLWNYFNGLFLGRASTSGDKAASSIATSPITWLAVVLLIVGILLLLWMHFKKIKYRWPKFTIVAVIGLAVASIVVASVMTAMTRTNFDVRTTITSFVSAFSTYKYAIFPLWMLIGVIFILTLLQLYRVKKDTSVVTFYTSVWFYAGVYCIGILLIYLLSFSNVEATRAASFDRYAATALAFIFIPLLSTFFLESRKTRLPITLASYGLIIGLTLLLVPMPQTTYSKAVQSADTAHYCRDEIIEASAQIKSVVELDDKVFVIVQGDDGYKFNWFRYELAPHRMNGGYWSFDQNAFTPEELMEFMIKNDYKYLYLFKSDKYFSDQFKPIFSDRIQENALYSVHPDGLIHP